MTHDNGGIELQSRQAKPRLDLTCRDSCHRLGGQSRFWELPVYRIEHKNDCLCRESLGDSHRSGVYDETLKTLFDRLGNNPYKLGGDKLGIYHIYYKALALCAADKGEDLLRGYSSYAVRNKTYLQLGHFCRRDKSPNSYELQNVLNHRAFVVVLQQLLLNVFYPISLLPVALGKFFSRLSYLHYTVIRNNYQQSEVLLWVQV